MKQLYLAILLICSAYLQAQNWCPPGAAWHYTANYLQTGGYAHWHYDADTVVLGKVCKIVRGNQLVTAFNTGDTISTVLGPVYTYSRGDTVYMLNSPAGDSVFYPTYYFNAQVGDNIYTRGVGPNNLSVVDSNGTTIINGDTLRFYTFHFTGACNLDPHRDSFRVIERIGIVNNNTGSFVPQWDCNTTDPYYYSLCNYKDSTFAVYPDSNVNCEFLYSTPFVYNHLLSDVNIWHYTFNVCGAVPSPAVGGYQRDYNGCGNQVARGIVFTDGDTVYNNITYKLLFVEANSPYFGNPDSCLLGFIREDTLTGQVYFLKTDSITETLLYNFGMHIGDSMAINFTNTFFQGDNYWQNGLYKLHNVHLVIEGGQVTSAYDLICDTCQQSHTLTWVQGTGNLADLLYPFSSYFGFACGPYMQLEGYQHQLSFFVTCFEHEQKVYFDTAAFSYALAASQADPNDWQFADSCDSHYLVGSISKLTSLSSFTTYPNPTSNKLNLQLQVEQSAVFDIYVKDMQGRVVLGDVSLGRLNAGAHSAELNLAGLNAGFYLVECRTAAGALYSKVVVQK